jgi:hypothetical protein
MELTQRRRRKTKLQAAFVAFACTAAQLLVLDAATITVTNTTDSGPGSLRAAIAAAAANDTIMFAVNFPATITLTAGELLVNKSLTISGPGPTNLTITANSASRVFHIDTSTTVNISGLTIADGLVSAGGVGGGVYVDTATLTLSNCVMHNNHATGGSTANGAGIFAIQSQLTLNGCTLDGNIANGNGGGIYSTGTTLTVDRSSLTNNSAVTGGGLFNGAGTVTLGNSTVFANTATHGGGAANMGLLGSATLTVNNCTFSSNTVSGTSATGSQIYNARQLAATSATISNSTVLSNNVAPTYTGGALFNDNGASLTIGNTILQATVQEHTIVNSGASTVASAGYNLAFDTGGGFLTAVGDQISTDPLLDISNGPRDNGGPTFTIPLQANSPAIDKGKRNAVAALGAAVDQRGEPRPFNDPNVANAVGGDGSDIGAYEADLRQTALARIVVSLRFNFTTIVAKSYQLQSRASLLAGEWGSFGEIISGNGGVSQLTATGALSNQVQFYRVLQTP